ncbi:MAG TPA: c-type cytochrome domain-containing protein [Verrucomicrobiae bacterium]|nr:c-type cytochrome domain-containing protein [Candidatus Acidoferrales bacterium]HXK03595.1 c-type cytochrome domain-containing protein [Verrucomicrobiae bacterium]
MAGEPSYYREVQPVLQKNCIGCHQPAMKSSGLDLTTYDGFRAGGKRGPAFSAGAPGESLVVRFVTGEMKPSMPLGAPPLAKADVEVIRDWIASGARDDSPRETLSTGPAIYHQPPVITALRFSPDGKLLAVGGNREILLHDAAGAGVVKRLPGKAERVLSLAFSSDGSLLIAGGGTPARFGELQFWDPREGKLLRSVLVGSDTVFGASLSPDAKKVAVGCSDNTVHVFDSANGRELYKISSHENWVLATVFGVDSKRFVSVGRDRAAKLVDAEKGQFLENVNQLRGELAAVARHPAKDVIVIGGEDRIPYVYTMDRPRNMKVGEEATLVRKLEPQDGPIFALDWSPDGKRIAVGGAGAHVNIYDAESGAKVAACSGHSAGIYTVAFSPDSGRLATGGFDGQVRLYSASDCTLQKAFVPVPLEANGAAQ